MYKFVLFTLAVLLLSNSVGRVNAYCIEDDGTECILDEECCTGFCDWRLSPYPYTGACTTRPPGGTPPKPCIPLYTGQTCFYNVTCCQGYCERRYSVEGFCVIESPPGFPPIQPPAPIADVVAPVAYTNAPASAPFGSDLAPSTLSNGLTPTPSPTGGAIPQLDVPVAAPAPVLSGKNGAGKKHVAPSPTRSRKDGSKKRRVAPTPTPARKIGHENNKKKQKKHVKSACETARAPSPA